MKPNRSGDWLTQAESDLRLAGLARDNHFFSQACFVAQQSAEKALKALAYFRGAQVVLGHSASNLAKELRVNGELERAARVLDQYYLTARYPDSIPGGSPSQLFGKEEADEAVEFASRIVKRVKSEVSTER